MKISGLLAGVACAAFASTAAFADQDAKLTIEGQELPVRAAAPAHAENLDEVVSGWVYRSDETQALQLDDFDNPSFVFVDQAIDEWSNVDGSEGKSCSSCHADVADFAGLRTQRVR